MLCASEDVKGFWILKGGFQHFILGQDNGHMGLVFCRGFLWRGVMVTESVTSHRRLFDDGDGWWINGRMDYRQTRGGHESLGTQDGIWNWQRATQEATKAGWDSQGKEGLGLVTKTATTVTTGVLVEDGRSMDLHLIRTAAHAKPQLPPKNTTWRSHSDSLLRYS